LIKFILITLALAARFEDD